MATDKRLSELAATFAASNLPGRVPEGAGFHRVFTLGFMPRRMADRLSPEVSRVALCGAAVVGGTRVHAPMHFGSHAQPLPPLRHKLAALVLDSLVIDPRDVGLFAAWAGESCATAAVVCHLILRPSPRLGPAGAAPPACPAMKVAVDRLTVEADHGVAVDIGRALRCLEVGSGPGPAGGGSAGPAPSAASSAGRRACGRERGGWYWMEPAEGGAPGPAPAAASPAPPEGATWHWIV